MIQVAIVNASTVLTDAMILHALPALQTQVTRDFAPAWGYGAQLTFVGKGKAPPPTSWWLAILDDSDVADALGYHDLTPAGLPCAKVFAKTDIDNKLSWTVTVSHELLEMLVDPDVNLTVQKGDSFYAYEACDACFIEGSPVQTPEGPRAIEEIRAGDVVLDRFGHPCRVERAWCEGVPAELTVISTWGGRTLSLTPNHKTPIMRHGAQTDVRADAVMQGDRLMTPRGFRGVPTNFTVPFARLLGYYAAEGDIMAKKRPEHSDYVRFSFNSTEYDSLARDVCEIGAALGFDSRRYLDTRAAGKAANRATVHLKAPSELFIRHAGQRSAEKVLSDEVMGWSLDYKAEFIRGLFAGDGWRGYLASKRGRCFVVEYVTTSVRLASQVELILAQLGFATSLSVKPPKEQADGCKRHATTHLRLTGGFARDLARVVWRDNVAAAGPSSRRMNGPHVDESFVYVPVRSVVTEPNVRKDRVYNLTVAESHTYLVSNIGTHNCEDDSQGYKIGNVLVSDFVLPAYFESPHGAKLDFLGKIKQPFELLAGGYASVYVVGEGWTQVDGPAPLRKITRHGTKGKAATRHARRGVAPVISKI